MISTISVVLAVVVAVGLNGIVNKLFIGNCSTKVKTVVAVVIDAMVGAMIGYTLTKELIPTVTNAIVAVAVSDVSYDYIFKTIKAVVEKLKSFKKVADMETPVTKDTDEEK